MTKILSDFVLSDEVLNSITGIFRSYYLIMTWFIDSWDQINIKLFQNVYHNDILLQKSQLFSIL